MEHRRITLVTSFEVDFEKFRDYVYVHIYRRKGNTPFLLTRKFFDKMEREHKKYNWLCNVSRKECYFALAEWYIESYYKIGYWSPESSDNHPLHGWKTWMVNPLPILKGDISNRLELHLDTGTALCVPRIYSTYNIAHDGYLRLGDKKVRRNERVDGVSQESHPLFKKLVTYLERHPKVSNVNVHSDYSFDVDKDINEVKFSYLPSAREFNKWQQTGDEYVWVNRIIIDTLKLNRFELE